MKGIKSEDFPKVITGIGRLELANNLKDAIQEGSLRKPYNLFYNYPCIQWYN